MFSILDMINHALGYVNVNVKLKNQIYTLLGFVGNFYLIYISWRFFQNGAWLRGLLFGGVFIVLMYFIILNGIYYFTKKTAKFDLSPRIEKLLGGKPADVIAQEQLAKQADQTKPYIPANGIFEAKEVLPAVVVSSVTEQAKLSQIVTQMAAKDLVKLDYGGHTDAQLLREIQATGKPAKAIGQGVQVPYCELKHENHELVVYGGLNAMDSQRLGHITKVGLTDVHAAHESYQLFLATAVITGGPEKIAGRHSVIENPGDYQLVAQVAYQAKQTN